LGEDVLFTVSPPVVGFCEISGVNLRWFAWENLLINTTNCISPQSILEKNSCAIEQGKIERQQSNVTPTLEDFGWDKNSVSKIWFFDSTSWIPPMVLPTSTKSRTPSALHSRRSSTNPCSVGNFSTVSASNLLMLSFTQTPFTMVLDK